MIYLRNDCNGRQDAVTKIVVGALHSNTANVNDYSFKKAVIAVRFTICKDWYREES